MFPAHSESPYRQMGLPLLTAFSKREALCKLVTPIWTTIHAPRIPPYPCPFTLCYFPSIFLPLCSSLSGLCFLCLLLKEQVRTTLMHRHHGNSWKKEGNNNNHYTGEHNRNEWGMDRGRERGWGGLERFGTTRRNCIWDTSVFLDKDNK